MIMEVAKGDLRAFMRKHVHWGITNLHKKNVPSLTASCLILSLPDSLAALFTRCPLHCHHPLPPSTASCLIHSLPTALHCLPTALPAHCTACPLHCSARDLIRSLPTAHCSASFLIRSLHQVELSFERNEWRLKPRALDEASAATKIQAGFRGKAGRKRHNKVNHEGGVC